VIVGGSFPQDRHPHLYQLFYFLSAAFINLIKGLIVPLLVSTVIVGIAQTEDIKSVGRMGAKALLYFEVVTTIALFIGLGIANTLHPGAGLVLDTLVLDTSVAHAGPPPTGWEIALHAFPSNVIGAASGADILPVVVFSALFGIALTRAGARGKPVLAFFEGVAEAMFRYTEMVMKLTPVGVFGSMAYNVSHMAAGYHVGDTVLRGWPAVLALLKQYALLVGSLYLSLAVLFVGVFVPIMLVARIRPLSFLRAIREPILTAYSTSSSDAALPELLEQLIRFGVPRRVAAFVIPAGYSFNLDGSTLYLVLASLTIAQAAHIHMTLGQQLTMLVTFVLTSKGLAAGPRTTLVIIAATADSFRLPGQAGVAMILAVDGIMDMARTALNVTGNGLASVVIAKWEGVFASEPVATLVPPESGVEAIRTGDASLDTGS
jgi:Na+/H+-dicarboxylate symporter